MKKIDGCYSRKHEMVCTWGRVLQEEGAIAAIHQSQMVRITKVNALTFSRIHDKVRYVQTLALHKVNDERRYLTRNRRYQWMV